MIVVCSGCGAHLIDGTKKCPFCKEIFSDLNGASSDMTYKIDSINQVDLIKNTSRESISLERRREKIRRKRRQKLLGYGIILALLAVVVGALIGIVSLIAHLFADNTEYSTAFYTGNQLKLCFDGTVVSLTDEMLINAGENSEVSLENEGIIKRSENGKVTCFLDKYDTKKKQGTLKLIVKDKAKDIKTISENVSGGFLVSDDGEHVLFIKNGNIKGNRGELWYSNKGKKPVKIADKVDRDKVIFSDDFKKVLYIKNYNYKTLCGDAYVAGIGDFSEEKIDTEVYALYMTANKGKTYFYAKNYNDSETYDLYMNCEGDKTCIVTSCGGAPVLSEKGNFLFAYGDKNGERFNLYRINIKKKTAEKIISNMNEIIRVSDNGKQVFYSKLFDNNVGDYYIWTEGETELKVADGVKYTRKNQVAVSEDFKKIAYIANFNEDKLGGILYYCEYKKDEVSVPEKISEDVYDCYVLNNGKIVYNKNYNSSNKTTQLYIYGGIEDEINKEINPRLLRVFDDNILCVYDFNSSTGGNLYLIDEDMKEHKLLTDVFGFAQKDNGEFLIIKNKDSINNRFDLYETENLKEVHRIEEGVEGIILY